MHEQDEQEQGSAYCHECGRNHPLFEALYRICEMVDQGSGTCHDAKPHHDAEDGPSGEARLCGRQVFLRVIQLLACGPVGFEVYLCLLCQLGKRFVCHICKAVAENVEIFCQRIVYVLHHNIKSQMGETLMEKW